jgi:hypothetical protein
MCRGKRHENGCGAHLTGWPLYPTDDARVAALALAMESSEPDFDDLERELGWERANQVWQAACEAFDRKHAPEEFEGSTDGDRS